MKMKKKLVVLDAGHGQFGNPYPTFEGYYEGTQNYKLSLMLKSELEKRGFTVMLTRPDITDDPTLEERGGMAGNNGAVLFISLHSNAPTHDNPPGVYEAINGVETYYSLTDKEGNIPFAKAVNDAISELMQNNNRGIKIREYPDVPEDDYYGVIRGSAKSGCRQAFIIEHGFHTNMEDASKLIRDDFLAQIASCEAKIIEEYFA